LLEIQIALTGQNENRRREENVNSVLLLSCCFILSEVEGRANILGIVLVTLNECPMNVNRAFLLGGFVCEDRS